MRSTERLGNAADIARKQHNLIRTGQLLMLGFTSDQVAELRRDGVIERIVRGLYRLPGTGGPLQNAAAALMRHSGSVASHRTALYLHGLASSTLAKPELTVPGPTATGRTTLGTIHRSPIPECDRTRVLGLPATSVARSVVDASQCLPEVEVSDLLNVVVARRLARPSDVEMAARRVEAHVGRRGHALLRDVLSHWTDDIAPESPAEAAILRRIHVEGLPRPVTQYVVNEADGEFVARVDLAWPAERVIREYDSDRFHGPERAEADELRRRAIESLGWRVGVLTRHDLRPSSTAWLQRLRADLHAGQRHVA